MQQHPLIAGAQPEKGTNLVRRQAVNVTQRHHCALLLRQLSQTILKLAVIFGCSSSGERGQGRGLPSGVQFRGHWSSRPRKRSGSTAGPASSAAPSDDHGTVQA